MENENVLAKNENASFKDIVTEKIKKEFVNFIPEEKWKDLINKGYESFEKEIPSIVKSMFHEEFKVKMKSHIDELTATHWGMNGKAEASHALKQVVEEAMPKAFSEMIAQFVGYAMSNIRGF